MNGLSLRTKFLAKNFIKILCGEHAATTRQICNTMLRVPNALKLYEMYGAPLYHKVGTPTLGPAFSLTA